MNIKLEIPESFYQGEERCGYYVSPEMKRVWAVQLDLLAEFARVCEKHNLKWWIDAGTLLGAVRHKGFIPWDDDVDVIMMREDYSKLCKIAHNEFRIPYRLSTEADEGYGVLHSMSKLSNEDTTLLENYSLTLMKNGIKPGYSQGIYIDVFPIDNIPDDEVEAKCFLDRLYRINYFSSKVMSFTEAYTPATKLWKRPIKAILHILCTKLNLNSHLYFRKFFEIIRSVNAPKSERVAKIVFIQDPNFRVRRIWNRSYFDNTVYLPFETLNLPAPSGYIDILDHFYGNWHEYFIRERHGGFYDTERPYTYYIQEGHPINEDKD